MRKNHSLYDNSLPQITPACGVPIVSLAGLLDLLTVLEDQLANCPGAIPVIATTLRDSLLEVLGYSR
jgi:hypothetical protein